MTSHHNIDDGTVTIRLLGQSDRAAIERLAALDSRPPPAGEALGAEVDGRLVAAISVMGDGAVADPFRPTAGVTAMLELRAGQLRTERKGGARRFRLGLRRRFAGGLAISAARAGPSSTPRP